MCYVDNDLVDVHNVGVDETVKNKLYIGSANDVLLRSAG